MVNGIEFRLKEVEKYFNSNYKLNIKKDSTINDGRFDSLKNEKYIREIILSNFPEFSNKKNNRDKGDLYLDNNIIDIKIISENNKSNNNIGGMVGVVSCLLETKASNYKQLVDKIVSKDYNTDGNKDIYFICVIKETTSVHINSFRHLKDIIINPSNGFQAKLVPENYKKDLTTNEEIIKLFYHYTYKRAEPYFILKRYMEYRNE